MRTPAPSVPWRSATRARPSWRGTVAPASRSGRHCRGRTDGPRASRPRSPPSTPICCSTSPACRWTPTSPRRRSPGSSAASTSRPAATSSSPRSTRGSTTGWPAPTSQTCRRHRARSSWTARRLQWSERAADVYGLSIDDFPELVACDETLGRHHRVRSATARGRSDGRPAGRPAGGGLHRTRVGQVHLRHRDLPAGQHRPRACALECRARDLAGLGDARRHPRLVRRRAGLQRRRGGRVAAARRADPRAPGPRCTRRGGRRHRRRPVRPVVLGSRRPGVGPRRHGEHHRPGPVDPARAHRACVPRRPRRGGHVARARGRVRRRMARSLPCGSTAGSRSRPSSCSCRPTASGSPSRCIRIRAPPRSASSLPHCGPSTGQEPRTTSSTAGGHVECSSPRHDPRRRHRCGGSRVRYGERAGPRRAST